MTEWARKLSAINRYAKTYSDSGLEEILLRLEIHQIYKKTIRKKKKDRYIV